MKDEPDEDWTEEQIDEWARHATMEELIERSSLGTPEAVAHRASTPWWVTVQILRGIPGIGLEETEARIVERMRRLGPLR